MSDTHTKVKLTTNLGSIVIQLEDSKAPVSAANFISYVKQGFYNGTIFHRVIKGFMAQGGGFDTSFSQKPTNAPIKNEADNGLKNKRGTLAMARTSDPNSATAQFFINYKDNIKTIYMSDNTGEENQDNSGEQGAKDQGASPLSDVRKKLFVSELT